MTRNPTTAARDAAAFLLSHFAASKEAVDEVLRRAEAAGATLIRWPGGQSDEYTGEFESLDGQVRQIMWNGGDAAQV